MKMKRDGKVCESTIVTQCCLVLDIIGMVLECTHVPTIYPLTVMWFCKTQKIQEKFNNGVTMYADTLINSTPLLLSKREVGKTESYRSPMVLNIKCVSLCTGRTRCVPYSISETGLPNLRIICSAPHFADCLAANSAGRRESCSPPNSSGRWQGDTPAREEWVRILRW
jgi:hypothetical protein